MSEMENLSSIESARAVDAAAAGLSFRFASVSYEDLRVSDVPQLLAEYKQMAAMLRRLIADQRNGPATVLSPVVKGMPGPPAAASGAAAVAGAQGAGAGAAAVPGKSGGILSLFRL